MRYSGDPHADFLEHDADQERWLSTLPRCSECGEPIQDEYAYLFHDEWIHEECMEREYKRRIY